MKKETVSRFSVSLPPSLLRQLDEMSSEKGYDNRPLAIADMIRNTTLSNTGRNSATKTSRHHHAGL